METLLLLGCFFIFKYSISQMQLNVSGHVGNSGYKTWFDGTKIYKEVRGSIENTFYYPSNSKNES